MSLNRKIIAFVQTRTDSTRLPQKALMEILDLPMIVQQLTRVKRSQLLEDIILLTTKNRDDNRLKEVVEDSGFKVFRAENKNVLKRFYRCAKKLNLQSCDIIVRLTGDCPLIDPKIIDESIRNFLDIDVDFLSNSEKSIYPDGFDVEVFTFKTLEVAYKNAKTLPQKEHVTPYIKDSGLFKIAHLNKTPVYPNWRLTVDYYCDFVVIKKIYQHFNSNNFSFEEIIAFIEQNRAILNINSYIQRNEGYFISIQKYNNSSLRFYYTNKINSIKNYISNLIGLKQKPNTDQ